MSSFSVWPYRDNESHRAEISYSDADNPKNQNKIVCLIQPKPDNKVVFSIQPTLDDGTTEKKLTSFLETCSKLSQVKLRWYDVDVDVDVDDKQGITDMNIKLNKLPDSYYSLEMVPSVGSPANKGGKSVRRHYRKRKSNRHVSNKKYSAASRRVRRNRKN